MCSQPAQEFGQVAEEQALVHPQQVTRREDHGQRGDPGDNRVVGKGAHEHEELADETG